MDLKRCNTCRRDLPITEFARHRKGTQSKCKSCNRAYQKLHYQRNKATYIDKAAAWMAVRKDENLKRILNYFKSHPCVDCGETDPIVLQFDHVTGVKLHEVTDMLHNGTPWAKIAAEIAKCEIRCANCHWRRHAAERGWRKIALMTALEN